MGLSKQLKQKIQTRNITFPEANQLATYKRGRGFELGTTGKQIQVKVTTVPSLLWKLEKPQENQKRDGLSTRE